jgi:hypothetical protein
MKWRRNQIAGKRASELSRELAFCKRVRGGAACHII